MSAIETMLERNKDFAARETAAGTLMPSIAATLPNVKALVISCADMRVDPALVLGIPSGEAAMFRNIGGRVTPGLLEQVGLLGRIGEVEQAVPGGGGEFHIVVMQHTDCGIKRLADDTAQMAHYFGVSEGEVEAKKMRDPRAAVAMDVATLRAITALPAAWTISGLVYDVATGLAEVVVAPGPLRPE